MAFDRPSTEITEKLLERWRATEARHTMSKEIIHLLAMTLPLESPEMDAARLVGRKRLVIAVSTVVEESASLT